MSVTAPVLPIVHSVKGSLNPIRNVILAPYPSLTASARALPAIHTAIQALLSLHVLYNGIAANAPRRPGAPGAPGAPVTTQPLALSGPQAVNVQTPVTPQEMLAFLNFEDRLRKAKFPEDITSHITRMIAGVSGILNAADIRVALYGWRYSLTNLAQYGMAICDNWTGMRDPYLILHPSMFQRVASRLGRSDESIVPRYCWKEVCEYTYAMKHSSQRCPVLPDILREVFKDMASAVKGHLFDSALPAWFSDPAVNTTHRAFMRRIAIEGAGPITVGEFPYPGPDPESASASACRTLAVPLALSSTRYILVTVPVEHMQG